MSKVSIPLTDEDIKEIINFASIWVKDKDTLQIRAIRFYLISETYKKYFLFLNPVNNYWEDWNEELEEDVKNSLMKSLKEKR